MYQPLSPPLPLLVLMVAGGSLPSLAVTYLLQSDLQVPVPGKGKGTSELGVGGRRFSQSLGARGAI